MNRCSCLPRYAACWLFLGLMVLVGCGSGETQNDAPGDVSDDLGRTISVDALPQRLLSLAPSATELVYAAGGGSKLVGVTTADDYPPSVDTLRQISALPIDFEAVVSLEPDLVFASEQVNASRDAETLHNLGIDTYFFSATTLIEIFEAIESTGEIIGRAEYARQRADSLRSVKSELQEISEQVTSRPRVLFLVGDETLYSFGGETHIHNLIELAGGESITQHISNPAPTLSEEFVIDHEPDVIIGAFGDNYDTERLAILHPAWDDVPAIRERRVYSLDADIVVRPGPRLLQGARQMGAFLHPDLY